jgi:hypothetical protein
LRALLDRPRPYSEEVVASAIAHLRNGGWVDQAVDAALDRLHKAQRLLLDLPDTKVRAVLTNLGDYLVERVEAARS